jgi:hypothetical protein
MPIKPRESQIEMERRHVLEGEARVARQEALIQRLDPSRHLDLVLIARDLLEALRKSVAFAKARLSSLERFDGQPK